MGEASTMEKNTGVPDIETMSRLDLGILNNQLATAIEETLASIRNTNDTDIKKDLEVNLEHLKKQKEQVEAKLSSQE